MKNNLWITILIGLFLGLFLLREYKVYSGEPSRQLQSFLQSQGYQNIQITDGGFGFCPKILEIPVHFQASLPDKVMEGIACFSTLGSLPPRIQFKN
jgi:hypothetical protein